jgi:hypothetical protein
MATNSLPRSRVSPLQEIKPGFSPGFLFASTGKAKQLNLGNPRPEMTLKPGNLCDPMTNAIGPLWVARPMPMSAECHKARLELSARSVSRHP